MKFILLFACALLILSVRAQQADSVLVQEIIEGPHIPGPEAPCPDIKKDTIRGEVYMFVETEPEFPGGKEAMMRYLSTNLVYPEGSRERNEQGKCYLRFVVTDMGAVTNVNIVRSSGFPELDKEATRVVRNMPRWTPGKLYGVPVNVYFTLPVSFKLN